MLEEKAIKKRKLIKQRIEKEINKNGFTVDEFVSLYDTNNSRFINKSIPKISPKRLKKMKKIYEKMKKNKIYIFDLSIYKKEKELEEKILKERLQKSDTPTKHTITTNNDFNYGLYNSFENNSVSKPKVLKLVKK